LKVAGASRSTLQSVEYETLHSLGKYLAAIRAKQQVAAARAPTPAGFNCLAAAHPKAYAYRPFKGSELLLRIRYACARDVG
jgi:hypothetical protein